MQIPKIFANIVSHFSVSTIFVRVLVAISSVLIYASSIIGWAYFVAWSVSFYPQMFTNCRRKSVVGLNFDFISLNVVGFMLYATFNIGLYYSEYIQVRIAIRNREGQGAENGIDSNWMFTLSTGRILSTQSKRLESSTIE